MWVSAFQTHSEVGVGLGRCGVGGSRGPGGILGAFLSYLVKGEGGSTRTRCLWPFQEDVLPIPSFHNCWCGDKGDSQDTPRA